MRCEGCGNEIEVGSWPFCPDHRKATPNIIRDEIVGGLTIENLGSTPVTVYSHSERKAIMRARGLVEKVQHVGERGSDKSPHTTRWV